MATVQFRGVCLTYPGDEPIEALRDISFDVANNEFVSIIGPSGSGKSTLLRLIADLLPITSGHILINDAPCSVARRNREIGFVFQEPALLPWRSSEKNVRLPLEVLKRDGQRGRDKAAELLRLVGLEDFGSKRPDQLSGGMRQRVSIARALTYDPDLLLMDEPFGALDQITRDEMNNELLRIWSERRSTVIFVTHSISEAIYLSDRVAVLSPRPGRLIDIVQVPLQRPRDPAMKHEQQFYDTELRVLRALEGGTVSGVPG
jgi:NitT/TauT family transport system ATP-binding protein